MYAFTETEVVFGSNRRAQLMYAVFGTDDDETDEEDNVKGGTAGKNNGRTQVSS